MKIDMIRPHQFQRFLRDEGGSTAIEYCLIAALIFLAVVSAVNTYAENTSTMYNEITDAVEGE